MRVLAVEAGVYNDTRRRAGTEFEMADSDISRTDTAAGGQVYRLPSWVVPASDAQRQLFAKKQELAAKKAHDAAVYASGGTRKKNTFEAIMRAGRGPQTGDPNAAAAALASSGTVGAKAKKEAFKAAEHAGRGPQTVRQ